MGCVCVCVVAVYSIRATVVKVSPFDCCFIDLLNKFFLRCCQKCFLNTLLCENYSVSLNSVTPLRFSEDFSLSAETF